MYKIELRGPKGKGLYTLVDKEDFEKYGHYNWNISSYGYAYTNIRQSETKKYKIFYLHRLIMNNPEGLTVDHINNTKLDNRRSNLRVCTQEDNTKNREKRQDSNNNYKGVYRHTQTKTKTFTARIKVNGKKLHLGCFKTEEEAANAYNEAAYIYFGEFAKLNKVIL